MITTNGSWSSSSAKGIYGDEEVLLFPYLSRSSQRPLLLCQSGQGSAGIGIISRYPVADLFRRTDGAKWICPPDPLVQKRKKATKSSL
jgi:hypothetical protein